MLRVKGRHAVIISANHAGQKNLILVSSDPFKDLFFFFFKGAAIMEQLIPVLLGCQYFPTVFSKGSLKNNI